MVNPFFSASAKLSPEALQDSSVPFPSTASGPSSSNPSSGDSAHHSCPERRRRTSIVL